MAASGALLALVPSGALRFPLLSLRDAVLCPHCRGVWLRAHGLERGRNLYRVFPGQR